MSEMPLPYSNFYGYQKEDIWKHQRKKYNMQRKLYLTLYKPSQYMDLWTSVFSQRFSDRHSTCKTLNGIVGLLHITFQPKPMDLVNLWYDVWILGNERLWLCYTCYHQIYSFDKVFSLPNTAIAQIPRTYTNSVPKPTTRDHCLSPDVAQMPTTACAGPSMRLHSGFPFLGFSLL